MFLPGACKVVAESSSCSPNISGAAINPAAAANPLFSNKNGNALSLKKPLGPNPPVAPPKSKAPNPNLPTGLLTIFLTALLLS